MKFLHKYDTENAFEADYDGTAYTEPWVSFTEDVDRVDYNKIDADFIFDAADMLGTSLELVYANEAYQVDGRDSSHPNEYYYGFGSSSELLNRPQSFKVRILNANLLSQSFESTLDIVADIFDAGSGGFSVAYVFDGIGDFTVSVTTWDHHLTGYYYEYS